MAEQQDKATASNSTRQLGSLDETEARALLLNSDLKFVVSALLAEKEPSAKLNGLALSAIENIADVDLLLPSSDEVEKRILFEKIKDWSTDGVSIGLLESPKAYPTGADAAACEDRSSTVTVTAIRDKYAYLFEESGTPLPSPPDPTKVFVQNLRDMGMAEEKARGFMDEHIEVKEYTIIDFDSKGLTDTDAVLVAMALTVDRAVESLGLYNNNITDGGAAAIAAALSANSTVKVLNLSDNKITDRGATAIANALATNSALAKLWLRSNNIADGVKEVVRAKWLEGSPARVVGGGGLLV